MSATLVDSNVLLDAFTDDASWADWSIHELNVAAIRGPVLINDVIFAEVSVRYASVEQVESALDAAGAVSVTIPRHALFMAGKAFRRYRASGGSRTGVLSDFFIGAHAAVSGLTLLTRDFRRYRTYFPDVELVTPPLS